MIFFSSAGDNIIEIGANWIHGPSEENPVFCLARQYGLLDPEALTPENQTMDIGGHPPWVPNIFTSSGMPEVLKKTKPVVRLNSQIVGVEICVRGAKTFVRLNWMA